MLRYSEDGILFLVLSAFNHIFIDSDHHRGIPQLLCRNKCDDRGRRVFRSVAQRRVQSLDTNKNDLTFVY